MTTASKSIGPQPAPVLIADTTLRDECLVDRAHQAVADNPGGPSIWRMSASPSDRIADMAVRLERLRVDVIEAGFPTISRRGRAAVEAIAREFRSGGPVVSAVVAVDGALETVDRAWEAIREAANPRLHLFTATDQITDGAARLRDWTEIVEEARAAIVRARAYTDDVEFSPAQADGDLVPLVAAMTEAAIGAGATTINVRTCAEPPPYEPRYRRLLSDLLDLVPDMAGVTLSADCFSHDLRGIAASDEALSCALAAVELGARQVKCTIHGVSATPGHVRLEDLACLGGLGALRTQLVHSELNAAGAQVASSKGYTMQPSDPFVGDQLIERRQ